MSETIITAKVAKLSDLRCAEDAIRARYQAQMDAATAPLQAQIDALMAGIQPQIDALGLEMAAIMEPIAQDRDNEITETKNEADQLEQEVRADVIGLGKTVKAGGLQVQYCAAKVTWDAKALAGYEAAHPEIGRFKKLGEPSTRIVTVAEK